MKNAFVIIIAMSFVAAVAKAQQLKEPNLKFGSPTNEELTMDTYELDSEAEAVVLCSLTDVYYEFVNGGFRIIYEIKQRVKVLKPEGKNRANISIMYTNRETGRDTKETVTGLKATAYNMEQGKVVKTKMTGDMVFTERVDKDNMLMKFTVPQVRQGTVFEYQYKLTSDFYSDINVWYAQTDIPVAYTKYELIIPEYFKFHLNQTGICRVDAKTESTNVNLLGLASCSGTANTFVGRSLPAIKDDEFIWNVGDFNSKVTAELSSIVIPGVLYKDFTATWENVDKMLMDDDEFGGRVKARNPLQKEMQAEVLDGDVPAKIRTLAKLLRKHVKWNGKTSLWANPLGSVIKKGTGNSAEMNFILLSMLRDSGIEAYPVVLRTRSQGRLPFSHPSVKSLNTVIVGVADTDSTFCYVDASAQGSDVNALPPSRVVDRARLLAGSGGLWVNLAEISKGQTLIGLKATLKSDGTLQGRYDEIKRGCSAFSARYDYYQAKDSAEYISKRSEKMELTAEKHRLSGRNGFTPEFKESMVFTKKCDVAGDIIYVNPLVANPVDEGLFSAEKRDLPVELPYMRSLRISSNIVIPKGYHVEDVPARLNVMSPDGGISCQMQASVDRGMIVTMFRFNITKIVFTVEDYQTLKQTFDMIAEKSSALITIKKD